MFCYFGLPLTIRLGLLVLSPVVALVWIKSKPKFANRFIDSIEQSSRRPILSLVIVFCASLLANLSLGTLKYPYPTMHDEWAYLLAADTYASGRLTNQVHPHWEHFETFHVLSSPSYMAKYPPGNGLALGAGQAVTGHPIVGNWILMAFALAAVCWMLRGWISPYWAFVGTLLLSINVPMLMAWGQTFWGGGVALLGGALVFGSLRRLAQFKLTPDHSIRLGFLFGCGAVLLAYSRPFEGLLACAGCSIVLLFWLFHRVQQNWKPFIQFATPATAVGLAGVAFLLSSNKAVTGDKLSLPYSVHSKQYSATSTWIWGTMPDVPRYNLQRMESYYTNWSRARQLEARTPSGFSALVSRKINLLWGFFPLLGGICLLPLLTRLRKQRGWIRFAIGMLVILLVIELQFVHNWTYPHYLAPVACLFYVLLFDGLRLWQAVSRKKPLAQLVVPTVVAYSLLSFGVYGYWLATVAPHSPREMVENKLLARGGHHLVFVEYPNPNDFHSEWVYNRADIDRAKIVWANSLTDKQNRQLVSYYNQQRQVWSLDANTGRMQPGLLSPHTIKSEGSNAVATKALKTTSPVDRSVSPHRTD